MAPSAPPPVSPPVSWRTTERFLLPWSQSVAPPQHHAARTDQWFEPLEQYAEADAGWEGRTEKQTCGADHHEMLRGPCAPRGASPGTGPLPGVWGAWPAAWGCALAAGRLLVPTPAPDGGRGPAPLSLGLACASPLAMCVRLHVYDSFQSSFSPHKIFILVVQGPVIAISHPELFIPCTD